MRAGADPCLGIIVTDLEDAACRLGPGADAPSGDEGAPSGRHVHRLGVSPQPAKLACRQTRATRQAVPAHPRRWLNLAPERLGTEPARAMLSTSGRTFRRTALGEPDTTTNWKNARDVWAGDTVLE
jgi:hypothetical protein